MTNEALAADIAKSLEETLATETPRSSVARPEPSSVAPIPLRAAQPPSLEQLQGQMSRYDDLKTAMSTNLAKVGRDLKAGFETEVMRIQHDFDTKVAETVERLERERSAALRKARDDYHNRLSSIDLLSQRLGQ